jgi:hypothetical protein
MKLRIRVNFELGELKIYYLRQKMLIRNLFNYSK